MGTPDFAAGILKAILDNGYTVTGVVTQPDRPKGRKKELCPCPVKELAVSRGLRVFQPRRVRNEEAVAEIADMKPDLIVVAAFGQILPKELLELPPLGCVNVHASLLPAYRGAAPIQQAIIDGCEKTGVTIMQMDVGLDTGDIISVRECPISPEETGGSLFDKLAVIGAELLVDTLPDIESGKAVRVPQPEENVSYVKMFKKEDGRIDWTESAELIERMKETPNLYGDTTWVPLDNVLRAVEAVGSERILFGTDNPMDGKETLRYSKKYFVDLKDEVSEEDYENIMHKNAERLFGINLSDNS